MRARVFNEGATLERRIEHFRVPSNRSYFAQISSSFVKMSLRNGLFPREGVSLYYEIQGTGPLIFLISAGYGTSEPYSEFALALSSHFTVVTFDRRGFYRSKKLTSDPWSYRTLYLENANDTAALINHFSEEPVKVFASSNGCFIAMELLRQHPKLVEKLIIHEPPPTLSYDKETFESIALVTKKIIDANRESGAMAAMPLFMPLVMSEREQAIIRESEAYTKLLALSMITLGFFFDYEMQALREFEPPLEIMDQQRGKITLLFSNESDTPCTTQPIKGLAKRLRLPLTETEGGHIGYASHPENFAQIVRQAAEGTLTGAGTNDQMVKSKL